jgi:hypothetical protein
VNFPDRYLSRRKAKLLAGPSDMTLSTCSRSKKYSRMSGISNAGFLSLSANNVRLDSIETYDEIVGYICYHRIPGIPLSHQCRKTTQGARQGSHNRQS